MINIRALANTLSNIDQHEYNIQREKEELKTPLKSIPIRDNEKIIKIDKFIFSTFLNIDSIDYELNLGISKVEGINKNYYLKIGGNEERISFEAKIFIEYLEHFNGFLQKIKARKPLSFSTLESVKIRKILIDRFSTKTKDWALDSSMNATFFTKIFSISGVIL